VNDYFFSVTVYSIPSYVLSLINRADRSKYRQLKSRSYWGIWSESVYKFTVLLLPIFKKNWNPPKKTFFKSTKRYAKYKSAIL